jgi:hypothetical protein
MIKKHMPLAIICTLTAASFWLIFNEFQTRPYTELIVILPSSPIDSSTLILRPLLLIFPFLLALTILGIYNFLRTTKIPVIIKIVGEQPLSMENTYDRLKVLSDHDKLVISTILRNEGKILQTKLKAVTKLPGYKITRILNRLEGLGVITREKYGMTNIIHLKFRLEKMPEL